MKVKVIKEGKWVPVINTTSQCAEVDGAKGRHLGIGVSDTKDVSGQGLVWKAPESLCHSDGIRTSTQFPISKFKAWSFNSNSCSFPYSYFIRGNVPKTYASLEKVTCSRSHITRRTWGQSCQLCLCWILSA